VSLPATDPGEHTGSMPGTTPSTFVDLIDLTPRAVAEGAPASFEGPPSPERGGRVYGGQFLAQAVVAAYRTLTSERRIHSLHAYFLRQGDVDESTSWQVDGRRDGRSFATRTVVGSQQGREVFWLMASFHTPEEGLDYLPGPEFDLDAVPSADDVSLTYVDYSRSNPDHDPESWFGQDRPMDIRYVNPPTEPEGTPVLEPQLTWSRVDGPVPDDPVVWDAGLAYLADATLVDHVTLPHGHRWHDARLTGASLDHAMWFHRSARPDEWLLLDQRVEATSGARGLATGRFYTASGQLVATCGQEGLMRWRR